MQKKINVIIYLPGLGGNFMRQLFSLDSSTYCWCPQDLIAQKDKLPRKDLYSYKNIYHRYKSWKGHHHQFSQNHIDLLRFIDEFEDTNFYKLNLSVHPVELTLEASKVLESRFKIKYFQVFLDSSLQHVVESFRHYNSYPWVRPGELELNQQYHEIFKPEMINFDNFILGEQYFLSEYQRLCPLFEVTNQSKTALELYQDWYKERQILKFLKQKY